MNHPQDDSSATTGGPDRSEEDPRLVAALHDYLAALEAGEPPSRQELLARYPDLGEGLAEYLDGLEFMHAASPRHSSGDGPANGAAPASTEIGERTPLGDYRILRQVGRGGMAVVYEAKQLSIRGRWRSIRSPPHCPSSPSYLLSARPR
jgi:hypothetical protein